MPMVASNWALVAPAFIATAKPWMISPAPGPTMWMPTTRSLAWSTMSFTKVFSSRPVSVCLSGVKVER